MNTDTEVSSRSQSQQLLSISFQIIIFLGALLLFLIQPLVGKVITPKLGGVAQVWSVCLLFFQFTLLSGYLLTHALQRLSPKLQWIVYPLLFLLGGILMPHLPDWDSWQISGVGEDNPTLPLLFTLTRWVAIPAILLSTISGTIQNWFRLAKLGDPYPLYSISNLGSFGALLLFPIVLEPQFTVNQQIQGWNSLFTSLAILIILFAALSRPLFHLNLAPDTSIAGETRSEKTAWSDILRWLFLSACGTTLLASFTTHMTQDIAPIPLLWIVPLALYLLTFVLCFESRSVYKPRFFFLATIISVALMIGIPIIKETLVKLPINIIIFQGLASISAFFCLSMICQGELALHKPEEKKLTFFYLMLALGGFLGGLFVNFIAPLIFTDYLELPLVITLVLIYIATQLFRSKTSLWKAKWPAPVLSIVLFGLCFLIFNKESIDNTLVLQKERNFYSAVKVSDFEIKKGNTSKTVRMLQNGKVIHGIQVHENNQNPIASKDTFNMLPTSYYGLGSGFDYAVSELQKRRQTKSINVAGVGLGIGTISTYARPQDTFTFYELDPKIVRIATKEFRYLTQSKAKTIYFKIGDARQTLAKEKEDLKYDLILVDAFNGDGIPLHLLTQEAVKLYLSHLAPDGLLLFHCSNNYVDLVSPLANIADSLGLKSFVVVHLENSMILSNSDYVVLSPSSWMRDIVKQKSFRKQHPLTAFHSIPLSPKLGVWHDDFSNLFSVLTFF
ncbi:MAG: fused MFS/spermidine synthase [Cyanobacteria bacterium]|nr:fused MFS/spermidine synthase [Cyanobacteriota bacterium]